MQTEHLILDYYFELQHRRAYPKNSSNRIADLFRHKGDGKVIVWPEVKAAAQNSHL